MTIPTLNQQSLRALESQLKAFEGGYWSSYLKESGIAVATRGRIASISVHRDHEILRCPNVRVTFSSYEEQGRATESDVRTGKAKSKMDSWKRVDSSDETISLHYSRVSEATADQFCFRSPEQTIVLRRDRYSDVGESFYLVSAPLELFGGVVKQIVEAERRRGK